MNIEDIRDAVLNGRYQITYHANRAVQDYQITADEITGSVLSGEIIEEYPDDRPYPSCLIYGRTPSADPLHSVWGYNADERLAVLVTVYRPDPVRWVHWRIRRPKNDGAG